MPPAEKVDVTISTRVHTRVSI